MLSSIIPELPSCFLLETFKLPYLYIILTFSVNPIFLVPNPNFYINVCGTKTNRMIAETVVTLYTILTSPWSHAPAEMLERWQWGCG